MRIRTAGALALFIIILLLLIALFYVHLSPWFLWGLLPPGTIQLAVNQTYPAANLLTSYLSSTPLGPTLAQLSSTRLYAVSQTTDFLFVAAVPANPLLFRTQQNLAQQLNSAGFYTHRIGLVILAQKNNSTESPRFSPTKIGPVVRQTIRRLFSRTLPATPFLIARTGTSTVPFLDNSLTILGTNRGSDVQLIIAEQTINFRSIPPAIPPLPKEADELSVALPSHILSTIPEPLRLSWNEMLTNKFRFTHTRPDIISHLAGLNSPIVIQSGRNHATLVVADSKEEFTSIVHNWFQSEEAYSRRHKQAFRLPDGTLGYELAPGENRAVFTTLNGDGCRQESWPAPLSPDLPAETPTMQYLWLCESGNQTALSSDHDSSQVAASKPIPTAGSWHITLGSQPLTSLSLHKIQAAAVSGTDTQVIIHLKITP